MNILLTSVGRRGYLVQYFKDALKDKGKVYASNSDELSPALKYADEYVISPLIYDEVYIDFLLDYCKEKNIKLVIPLFDIDLYILAKNKEKFITNGITLAVSDEKFIKICNDKWLTYNFLKKNNILTPKTFISKEVAKEAIKDGDLKFPIIVKPRWGMGSLSVYTADNNNELDLFYDKIKRDIGKSYLKYEAKQDIERSVIIQEKIIGDEYSIDIINDFDGNYRNTIIKRKLAMRAGETDIAETVENDSIRNITKKIANLSKHICNLDMDILEENNLYYVLEMNARFGGGYPFSHLSGVNLPLTMINWMNGEETNENLLQARIGVRGQKDIKIIEI